MPATGTSAVYRHHVGLRTKRVCCNGASASVPNSKTSLIGGVEQAQVVTVDVHCGQIAGFFSPSCCLETLSTMPAAARFLTQQRLDRPVVVKSIVDFRLFSYSY